MSDWDNFVTITNTPLGFLLFGIIIFGLLIIIFGLLRKKPHKGMIGGDVVSIRNIYNTWRSW